MAVLEADFKKVDENKEANDFAEAVIISGPRKGEFVATGNAAGRAAKTNRAKGR